MEILLYANVLGFFWTGWCQQIYCVNSTLERRHVIQDFLLERLEQLEVRPMHNSSSNSFTLFKGHVSWCRLSSQVVKERCVRVQPQKVTCLQPPRNCADLCNKIYFVCLCEHQKHTH